MSFDLGTSLELDARIAWEVRLARFWILADVGTDRVGQNAGATHFDVRSITEVTAGMDLLPVLTHVGVWSG